jgi:hypothetical protein
MTRFRPATSRVRNRTVNLTAVTFIDLIRSICVYKDFQPTVKGIFSFSFRPYLTVTKQASSQKFWNGQLIFLQGEEDGEWHLWGGNIE